VGNPPAQNPSKLTWIEDPISLRRMRPFVHVAAALLLLAGCASAPPEWEEPDPADVLYDKGLSQLEGKKILWVFPKKDYDGAIETFQSVIDNYPYSDYAVLSELKIADAYFEDGKYEEALSYYRDFSDLHPQHEKVPYTIFRSALCHERRMRSVERDQTATREALVFLDRLLSDYPYSEYSAEAEEMWRRLRTTLAQQVMAIGDFYRNREEYESAAERYRSLLSEYPGLGLDAESLYKLGLCYAAMNRNSEAQNVFMAVVQNYNGTDVASEAEARIREADE
jgi:outer membrane protein assembly factor BamD